MRVRSFIFAQFGRIREFGRASRRRRRRRRLLPLSLRTSRLSRIVYSHETCPYSVAEAIVSFRAAVIAHYLLGRSFQKLFLLFPPFMNHISSKKAPLLKMIYSKVVLAASLALVGGSTF